MSTTTMCYDGYDDSRELLIFATLCSPSEQPRLSLAALGYMDGSSVQALPEAMCRLLSVD